MSAIAGAPAHAASTAEVESHVRDAMAHRAPLRIRGRGHWLHAGRPVRGARTLSLEALTGIVEYNPGDLTLTALAGTTLQEIASATAAERQWLALDPFGPDTSTLGATIATASAGPLAHSFGTPRDNVLGVEAVTGDARIIHAGGRVVKNVAGFDLTRLLTGSWGTLGVITEITVRLRALPEVEESWALVVDERVAALDDLLSHLRAAAIEPLALELVSPALATLLGVGDSATLLVRLGGNAESVRAQRVVLGGFGEVAAAPANVWATLRECEPLDAAVVRLSRAPSHMATVWAFAREAAAVAPGALLHASVGRGIARCIIPGSDPDDITPFVAAASNFHGTTIPERLPARSWSAMAWAPVSDDLSRGVKRSFDPVFILNPGILGEGS
jgi:glycolate oxidase FAD binding subunit